MEINVIGGQKWSVILGMSWLVHYNPKINWKIEEVKMMRYLEECRIQWRLKQGKLEWQKEKEKIKRKQNNRYKKSSRRVEDLG